MCLGPVIFRRKFNNSRVDIFFNNLAKKLYYRAWDEWLTLRF